MVRSFSDIIDALGGPAAFAHAIGMTPNAAKRAKARDSISSAWFTAIVAAAEKSNRGDITLERMAELAAERRQASAA